jgi:hypothetical protein
VDEMDEIEESLRRSEEETMCRVERERKRKRKGDVR